MTLASESAFRPPDGEDKDSTTAARGGPTVPTARDSHEYLADRPLAFYNALLTEHFVLESARGITVSESSSRASLYLMTLSSSLVAFGFLASTPYAFAYLGVVIPVVFLLGVFTYVRLVQTSLEDVAALTSIQRIRRYYGSLLPGATEYFPVSHGRVPNELLDIGQRGYRLGVFFTVSSAIGAVNSVVGGAGCALIAFIPTKDLPFALLVGILATLSIAILHGVYQECRYAALRRIQRSPGTDEQVPHRAARIIADTAP